MPDSVRCSVDPSQGPHTFNCEVDIGPEPSASSTTATAGGAAPAAPPPAAPPPATSPAVTALVNRFVVSRTEVHAPPVDQVTVGSAEMCLGQLTAVPVLLLGAKALPLAVLASLKVGYDLSSCVAKDSVARQFSADEAAAVKSCEADGGIPTGFVEHALMCHMPGTVAP